jgi:hypothetical protein
MSLKRYSMRIFPHRAARRLEARSLGAFRLIFLKFILHCERFHRIMTDRLRFMRYSCAQLIIIEICRNVMERSQMAIKRSGGEIIKSLGWFVGAIVLVGGLIYLAPIISHGG